MEDLRREDFKMLSIMQKISAIKLSGDCKEQVHCLKEICSEIASASATDERALTALVDLYINCSPKNPVKKVLSSIFQNFPNPVQSVVSILLHQQLKLILMKRTDNDDIRKLVDSVSSLLDNFEMGITCVTSLILEVMNFLVVAVSRYCDLLRKDLPPIKQNEFMQNCHVTLQTLNKMLQKCMEALQAQMKKKDDKIIVSQLVKSLEESTEFILHKENFMLDCKASCGISFVLFNKVLYPSNIVKIVLGAIDREMNGRDSKLDLNKLSDLSRLCCLSGMFSVLAVPDLVEEFHDNQCLLLDVFLDQFLQLALRCSKSKNKLPGARALSTWTNRAGFCVQSEAISPSLRLRLCGTGETMQNILDFVWGHWEDSVDAVRLCSRDIFCYCLQVHVGYLKHGGEEIQEDPFLLQLSRTLLLEVDWSTKGKYGCLCVLVEYVGTLTMLKEAPQLPSLVLSSMQEQSLARYASELYLQLYHGHKKETCINSTCPSYLDIWIPPVLIALSIGGQQQKNNIMEYILPKLFKDGKQVLQAIIHHICPNGSITSNSSVGVLITCLRRARTMGLIQVQKSRADEALFGDISTHLMQQALHHEEEQVRLNTLALLCENHKTSETICPTELMLIKEFLPWNLSCQVPSFRQYMLGLMKKFLYRLHESYLNLKREIQKSRKKNSGGSDNQKIILQYEAFVKWMFGHLLDCLLGASYPRRSLSLSLLSLQSIYSKEKGGIDCMQYLQEHHLDTLLECLADTFEDNKQEAANIFTFCYQHKKYLWNETKMINLMDTAMQLILSTNPQDCTTAAYLLKVILSQPVSLAQLDRCKHVLGISPKYSVVTEPTDSHALRTARVMFLLIEGLQLQVSVAKSSLLSAAACKPMYPILHCIRYLIQTINLRKLDKKESQFYNLLIKDLICCCLEISNIVSPVVHNSSPEGNVPQEFIGNPGDEEGKNTVTIMPEYLVVCCWRNIKEVSLILGQLCQSTPVANPQSLSSAEALLSLDQLNDMGEYFKTQLLDSKHRGAFELACAGFVKMCEMLWKSEVASLYVLPGQWLKQVLDDIQTDNPRLCATRRSAGVPFYIQTLISSEPATTGRKCFHSTMTELLKMALPSTVHTSNAQVHSLNVLRTLYRDTRLGEIVQPYVADGLMAAILGFQHPTWAVRNCSTLLLSALMTRIFGVNRVKDDSAISRKNCQTGRTFFHKYPSLYKFLLDQLSLATMDAGEDRNILTLNPSLYPILMVLGRLFPSHLEGTDTSLNLSAFIPLVIRCGNSPIMKTRIMSAQALQPLVHSGQLTTILQEIIATMPDKDKVHLHQNALHGQLLQVKQLLLSLMNMSTSAKSEIVDSVLNIWLPHLWLATSQNPCAVTRTTALRISDNLFQLVPKGCTSTNSWVIYTDIIKMEVKKYFDNQHEKILSFHPGFTDYVVNLAKISLTILTPEDKATLCKNLIASNSQEVRCLALEFVHKQMEQQWPQEPGLDSVKPEVSDNILVRQTKPCIFDGVVWYKTLVDLIIYERETHWECLIKVLYALDLYPDDVITSYKCVELFEKSLGTVECSPRDAVCGAAFCLTGRLLHMVIDCNTLGRRAQLLQWLDRLQALSQTEQPESLQLTCAQAIRRNALWLLTTSDADYLPAWKVLLDLLQEDSMAVKQEAAAVLNILTPAFEFALEPLYATQQLLLCFLSYHGKCWELCVDTFLCWITEKSDADPADEEKERLFDRSEMNTYREENFLVKLFTLTLIKYLLLTLKSDVEDNYRPIAAKESLKKSEFQENDSAVSVYQNIQDDSCTAINESKDCPTVNLDVLKSVYQSHCRYFTCLEDVTLSLQPSDTLTFKEKCLHIAKSLLTCLQQQEEMVTSLPDYCHTMPYMDLPGYRKTLTTVFQTQQTLQLAQCVEYQVVREKCTDLKSLCNKKLPEYAVKFSTGVQQ